LISNYHKKAIVVFYLITILLGVISLGFFLIEKPYRVSHPCTDDLSSCETIINQSPTDLMSVFINLTIVSGVVFLVLSVFAYSDKRKHPEDYAKAAPTLEFIDTLQDAGKTTEHDIYFHGFDYLRVILCVFVVALHTGLLGWTFFIVPNSHITTIAIEDIVYANVFFVAVPAFLLLSLFLYVHNMKNKIGYFRKRVVYLGTIYIFWSLIYMGMSAGGITGLKLLDIRYIISGGDIVFGLPYFLFDLILLIMVTEVLIYIKNRTSERSFILSNIILIGVSSLYFIVLPFLPTLSLPIDNVFIISGSSILNYLAYPSIVLLLYYSYSKGKLVTISWKIYALLSALIITSGVIEWIVLPNKVVYGGFIIPPYGRISVVLTSVLFILLALQVTKKAPRVIKELATLTLGIYLLHIPVMKFLEYGFHEFYLLSAFARLEYFIIIFMTTVIVTYMIKKTGVV
jgi:surface polysaccharide O-acyltransferase-like enzyme/cbb3-type cytochrome oxidase subunit 3